MPTADLHEALAALRAGGSIEEYQRQRQLGPYQPVDEAEMEMRIIRAACSGAWSTTPPPRWTNGKPMWLPEPTPVLTDEQLEAVIIRSACAGIWSECPVAIVTINGKTIPAPTGWRPRRTRTSASPISENESNEGTPS